MLVCWLQKWLNRKASPMANIKYKSRGVQRDNCERGLIKLSYYVTLNTVIWFNKFDKCVQMTFAYYASVFFIAVAQKFISYSRFTFSIWIVDMAINRVLIEWWWMQTLRNSLIQKRLIMISSKDDSEWQIFDVNLPNHLTNKLRYLWSTRKTSLGFPCVFKFISLRKRLHQPLIFETVCLCASSMAQHFICKLEKYKF